MALSRFYKPTNYEYMSQFVPKNLEIMDRGLQRAQAKQDKQVGKLDELNSMILKQNALEGYDTEVRDQIVEEVKSFSDEMANTDLTNPENFRKVNQFVQQYANDERIKKLNLGLASKAKYDKLKEDLLTKKDAYAIENDRIFMKEYERYLTQPDEGAKFAIDYIGGKELIPFNAPARPELEGMLNNKLASSYVYDDVKGTWKHKTTNKALTDEELRGIMIQNFVPFMETAPGQQMRRRAEMRMEQDPNWSLEKQYWMEVNPVIAEKTYSETKREFTDLSHRALNLQKLQENIPQVLVQKAKTPGLFAQYPDLKSYDDALNNLKQSANPTDQYKAAQMEAQKEKLQKIFSKTLSTREKYVLNTTAEDLRTKPRLLNLVAYELFGASSMLINLKDEFTINKVIERAAYHPDIVGKIVGKAVGVSYEDLVDKRDKFISSGEIFEAKDIILTASKGSTAMRNYIADQAKTAFNDNNLDILSSSNQEVSIDNTLNTIDKQSIKITDGIDGPEISYKYKDSDGKPQYITVASKDRGREIQETTDELYRNLAGGDPIIYTQLVESHRYSNLKPISENSTYNQKDDIINHLPEKKDRAKLSKANTIKIVNTPDGNVSIKATALDREGIEYMLYNITAPTIPQAMKLLEIQL